MKFRLCLLVLIGWLGSSPSITTAQYLDNGCDREGRRRDDPVHRHHRSIHRHNQTLHLYEATVLPFGNVGAISSPWSTPAWINPPSVYLVPTFQFQSFQFPLAPQPAIVAPRQAFGPRVNPNPNLPDDFADQPAIDAGPFDDLNEIRRRASVLKRSTPAGRQRADRLIAQADESFTAGKYGRAAGRYRDAIARAPDYPEAHFRLAHTYIAIGRFELALKHALVGLQLAGTAQRNGFSLDQLYQGNKFVRRNHDERLDIAIEREPNDGGLLFLRGFSQYFSNQPLQARKEFQDAADLQGAHQAFVRHFLPPVPIAEVDDLAVDK